MKRFIAFNLVLLTFLACSNAGKPEEHNYTIPTWTLYQRALKAGKSAEEARSILISKDYPYNINTTINGDPSTQMGVAWFTNAGVSKGVVQIAEGEVDRFSFFMKTTEVQAISVSVDTLDYTGEQGRIAELLASGDFASGNKRSYNSNKALITNLKPNTTYSYRVGNRGAWSEVGRFTTAKGNKDQYEFIYITDTQANTDEQFDISKKTVETAYKQIPDAKFVIVTGDLVNTGRYEWEWEQWFEKMQNIWLKLPLVPVQGNHDSGLHSNMFYHFNTDKSYNAGQATDAAKTRMDGTVYSFVYGDALFLVMSYESYSRGEPYFTALEQWMRRQIAANADVKWKIAAFHKTMFTGASHQNDSDGKIIRERMAPAFQEMGIDFVLQGHDHVYAVIGVLQAEKTADGVVYRHLPEAVSGQKMVTPTFTDGTIASNPSISVTGKEGGIFNVTNGVLYFLNNSAGRKKYYPKSKEQMDASYPIHGVNNYFELFNKLGQTSEPTFSRISVSTQAIKVDTYTVDEQGKTELFDSFSIVK